MPIVRQDHWTTNTVRKSQLREWMENGRHGSYSRDLSTLYSSLGPKCDWCTRFVASLTHVFIAAFCLLGWSEKFHSKQNAASIDCYFRSVQLEPEVWQQHLFPIKVDFARVCRCGYLNVCYYCFIGECEVMAAGAIFDVHWLRVQVTSVSIVI